MPNGTTQAQSRPWQRPRSSSSGSTWRLTFLHVSLMLFLLAIVARLGVLQILDHATYAALATGQHALYEQLYPERGQILVHDPKNNALVPIAMNQTVSLVYVDPRQVTDPAATALALGTALGEDPTAIALLTASLANTQKTYVAVAHDVSADVANAITALNLPGVGETDQEARLYPEPDMGGHVTGFVGSNTDGSLSGVYGIEGYFDKLLAGVPGSIRSEKDISGNFIALGGQDIVPAVNGSDIVLTIDRAIQFEACTALHQAVTEHRADSGSIIIVDPATGRILAMCGEPDFDPNQYATVPDISVYNNPAIFDAYEPGSVFKAITLSAGIDSGALTPDSTYTDTGAVHIGKYTIKNAEGAPRGLITMTQALDQSLNTGMVWALQKMGQPTFVSYVKSFGFGVRTGVELNTESAGDISSLDKPGQIYASTASFGQGITVTPLQLVMAYAAIAEGGVLKKPYIVDEIDHPDGTVQTEQPTDVRQVIDPRTAQLVSGMLVDVVENGLGHAAAVPGYYIAGKTGTAQVASSDGTGYDLTKTIGTFAGFGPVDNPRFAMIVRIDNPKDLAWAETGAAPVFGQIAAFLVNYFDIPPTRPIPPPKK